MNKRLKCDATGKTRFATPGEAKAIIISYKSHNRSKNKNKKAAGKSSLKRYYICKHCKGYHLTSDEYKSRSTFNEIHKQYAVKTKGLIVTQEEAARWKADSLKFPI
jgi:hypothetical protein